MNPNFRRISSPLSENIGSRIVGARLSTNQSNTSRPVLWVAASTTSAFGGAPSSSIHNEREYAEAGAHQNDGPGDSAAAGPANSNQISTSFFPPPPQVYKKFTKRNLRYLELINSHELADDEPKWDELSPARRLERQSAILQQHSTTQTRKAQDQLDGDDVDMEAIEEPATNTTTSDLPDFDLKAELEPQT